jgi:hypothetical protein
MDEGSASHRYCLPAIKRQPEAFVRDAVDFADAVHLMSLLHGQAPGVISFAASHIIENAARDWLVRAIDAFGRERSYLARLVVAAGPLPSTPGQHNLSQTLSQQRRALEMLAQSDRRGCALGAAVALVLDWQAVRTILNGGAVRLGIEPPECRLPGTEETLTTLAHADTGNGICRAVQFGAAQLLGQHRGVWDLLSARAQVRRQMFD